ncbi:MAG: glycosyltransferase family 9 protein, partial [Terriglobales bacterium]
YPAAALTVLAARGPHAVFAMAGFERLITVDRAGWRRAPLRALWGAPGLLARLRAGRFDLSVDLHSYKETNWLAYLAGVPRRVAMLRPTRSVARLINLPPPPDDPYGRLLERYCQVLAPLGIAVEDRVPRLAPAPEAQARAAEVLGMGAGERPLLGLCPGAGNPGRRWPSRWFAALAQRAVETWGARAVVFAGPEEDDRMLADFAGLPQVRVVGGLSIAELAAALARCRLVVTNPTGPSHLAAAVGARLLTLGEIPAFDPVALAPGQVTALRARGTVAALPFDEVLAAAAGIWAG